MEKRANIYYNNILAGSLIKADSQYIFRYEKGYLESNNPAISIAFPKTASEYTSNELFPFFYGLLAEGEEKELQCRLLGIDEDDHFTRLIKTAHNTIGAVTVEEEL